VYVADYVYLTQCGVLRILYHSDFSMSSMASQPSPQSFASPAKLRIITRPLASNCMAPAWGTCQG
jgi:hypothetical protein